ncbi:succinate dehydrogenase hydrophobic membrane anchor subunit [soil metagenome]
MSTVMAPAGSERGQARRGGGYEQPRGKRSNFELYSWFFMRISGLILIFLSLYHLVWWNLIVGVEHLSADLVRERWENPFWRLFNVALLLFAMLHGLNGLRYSIEDYVRKPGAQVAVKAVAYTLVLTAMAIGAFALFTYNPVVAAPTR